MANQEQLDLLKQGVETWNEWREENPETEVDLSFANLSHTNLSDANLFDADLSDANLFDADLSYTDLSYTDLSHADLSHANLFDADLSYAHLSDTILSYANLSNADLSHANLNVTQALQTNFNSVTLTGACIEDWHMNAYTNLQDIVCEYIFTKYDFEEGQFIDRRPHDPNQIFAPGEFTKRYQIVLETVELFFNDGIDWKAFLASLQDLKTQYGDDLNIQGIEKKAGGSFVVRVEVPSDADKGIFERNIKEVYESNLQILEAKYHAELQAKDKEIEIYKQKSADILELAKLAASRPIIVENEVVVEQQSNSETYNTTVHGNVGNLANKMQDQASQQTNQYIGANLNEITALIHSLRGKAESFPEAQKTEAIDHLTDLETDIQQPPEKRKPHRIKATLLALVAVATALSGAVTQTNEFVGQLQELADKLNIPLPIEQVEPESKKQDAIDVKAIDSNEP